MNGLLPNHGWAYNSQDMKLLWLPIFRLVSPIYAAEIRTRAGAKDLTKYQFSEIRAFRTSAENLFLVMREIAKCIRIGSVPPFHIENVRDRVAAQNARELFPIYIEITYIQLRRLADNFTRAARHVLFEHTKSFAMEYKGLLKSIESGSINNHKPLCDVDLLTDAIRTNSSWYDTLRQKENFEKMIPKGVRDKLMHESANISVGNISPDGESWQLFAHLDDYYSKRPRWLVDLLVVLKDSISDLCNLWDGICRSANLQPEATYKLSPYGDVFFLFGNDVDITYFWPEYATCESPPVC